MKHVLTRNFPDGTQERIVFRILSTQMVQQQECVFDNGRALFPKMRAVGPGRLTIEAVVDDYRLVAAPAPKRKRQRK